MSGKTNDARSRADSALQVTADGSPACSDIALGKIRIVPVRIRDGGKDMLFLHCPFSDVADPGVVGFSDQYIDAADGSAALLFLMKNIADEGIRHLSDIQGIGKSNGGFQTAKLLDLQGSCGLAVSVQHIGGCNRLFFISGSGAGENDSDTGVDIVLIHGAVSHADARHIGDFIMGACFSRPDLITVIANIHNIDASCDLSYSFRTG